LQRHEKVAGKHAARLAPRQGHRRIAVLWVDEDVGLVARPLGAPRLAETEKVVEFLNQGVHRPAESPPLLVLRLDLKGVAETIGICEGRVEGFVVEEVQTIFAVRGVKRTAVV